MRLRGKALLGVSLLAAGPTLLLVVIAGGLLRQVAAGWLAAAGEGAGGAGADPSVLAGVEATVDAAAQLLWLAGAAIAALATAVGVLAARRHLLTPVEAVARRLGADTLRHGDELEAISRRAETLQRDAERAERERHGQLDAVRNALDRAGDQLVEAQRLGITGRLALGAAHEIGSPLSIAIATVDALRAGSPPDELLPALDEALQRVAAILRELSRFGRPAEERAERVELAALARDVVALARLHPRARRVAIKVHTPEADTDGNVDGGDRTLQAAIAALAPRRPLEQVLLNLLINAADATAERGQIDIHCGLEVDTDGSAVAVLTVDDDGPGVPDHLRDRIFEPFFTSKADDVGTGLGLAISRRLVVAAGGRLEVDRSPTSGARFRVILPWGAPT